MIRGDDSTLGRSVSSFSRLAFDFGGRADTRELRRRVIRMHRPFRGAGAVVMLMVRYRASDCYYLLIASASDFDRLSTNSNSQLFRPPSN